MNACVGTIGMLVLCLLSATTAGNPPASVQADPPIEERTIDVGMPGVIVTTGTIDVPELHAEAALGGHGVRRITLAYVRVRRENAPTRDAHMLLAGGPGDSSVGQVMDMLRRGGPMALTMFDGDLIALDQRGTGRSLPNLAVDMRYDLPLDAAGSPDLWLPLMRAKVDSALRALRARGIRPEAYNTRESADDVETLRRRLGYERLTLWGRSYGTHLALSVLRRHPARVARLVLVAPEGPDDTWKRPSQVEPVLGLLGRRAGDPMFVSRMRRVLARLDADPVTVEVADPGTGETMRVVLGAFDLQWLTAQALADPRSMARLPMAYRMMEAGDMRDLARLSLMARRRAGIGNAMGPLIDLASGASAERRASIASESGNALLGDALNFPVRALSDAWGAADLGDEFRAPITSDAPMIVFAGDLDARTPVDNARRLVANLPNARLVIVENGTHAFDFFGTPALREETLRFLRGEPQAQSRVVLESLPFPQAKGM